MAETIRDRLWVWATIVNALQGITAAARHASTMTPIGGAEYLGVPNIVMAGNLPPTPDEAQPVQPLHRVAWEMTLGSPEDMEARRPNFDFTVPLPRLQSLAARYPNIEAVVLDDLSTTDITKRGMPASVLADLCFALQTQPRPLSLWGVVYSMSLDIPNLREYLNFLDVIHFWVWHARDLSRLDEHLDRCAELSGGKPVNLGLYLYDWGEQRPMPLDLMEFQCGKAVEYLQQKRITGVTLLATSILDVGLPTAAWTRDWVQRVGGERI